MRQPSGQVQLSNRRKKRKTKPMANQEAIPPQKAVILCPHIQLPEGGLLSTTIQNLSSLQLRESWFRHLPSRMGYDPTVDAAMQAFVSANRFFYDNPSMTVNGCVKNYLDALQGSRLLLETEEGRLSDEALLACALLGHFERAFGTKYGDRSEVLRSTLLHMHALQTLLVNRLKAFRTNDLDMSMMYGHYMLLLEGPLSMGVPSPFERIALQDPRSLIGHKAMSPTSILRKLASELQLRAPRFIADVRTHREATSVDEAALQQTLDKAIELLALKDEASESALLHKVKVKPTDPDRGIPLARYSFDFDSLVDWEAIVNYWHSRILILRAYWHLPKLTSMQDCPDVAEEGRRATSSLLMSWQYGLENALFGRIGLLYLPSSVWGAISDFYTDKEKRKSSFRESLLARINELYWQIIGSVTAEQMDEFADVYAGGPLRGRVVRLYQLFWPGNQSVIK